MVPTHIRKQIKQEYWSSTHTLNTLADKYSVSRNTILKIIWESDNEHERMEIKYGIKECKIEGCSLDVHSYGLCPGHYMRLRRYGDPNKRVYRELKGSDKMRIIKLKQNGHSLRSIARMYGVTHPTIRRVIQGLPTKNFSIAPKNP